MALSTTQVSEWWFYFRNLEFLAAAMSAQTFLKEQYLRTAFKMFDKDNSGKIDSTEIKQMLAGEQFKDLYSQ